MLQKSSRWLRIIGLLLLAFLLWKIDLRRMLTVLKQADPFLVAIAVALNLPQIGLKAIRWRRLLASQNISYPVSSALLAYFGSIFIGLLTPGRLGEFIKTWHVHHDCGVPKMRAFSSVLADRLFDLYALLLFGGAALLSKTVGHQQASLLGFAGSAVILVLPLLLFLHDGLFETIKAMGKRLGKLGTKLFADESWLLNLRTGLKDLSTAAILGSTAITVGAYALFFLQCHLLALAVNLNAGFLQTSFAVALGSLITLLPISISGLGTREAAIMAYLGSVGVSSEASLGYSLLVFATFYVAGALFGMVAWWIKPVSWNTVRQIEQDTE
jgi:hypothetical protein